MTSAELKNRVLVMLGLLSTQVSDAMYEVAEGMTIAELGWSLPNDNAVQSMWLTKRCRRYICEILLTQASDSVKHKQTSHDQKFDHLNSLIKTWDEEFRQAIESDPYLFANVDVSKMFGTYKGAGYAYDFLGNDVTNYGS